MNREHPVFKGYEYAFFKYDLKISLMCAAYGQIETEAK